MAPYRFYTPPAACMQTVAWGASFNDWPPHPETCLPLITNSIPTNYLTSTNSLHLPSICKGTPCRAWPGAHTYCILAAPTHLRTAPSATCASPACRWRTLFHLLHQGPAGCCLLPTYTLCMPACLCGQPSCLQTGLTHVCHWLSHGQTRATYSAYCCTCT
jgi:hypothetical protein